MTLPTLSSVITKYLYESSSVPQSFVDPSLIRDPGLQAEISNVSSQEFMAGPGRFALASSFALVGDFFDEVTGYDVTQLFDGQTDDEVRLSKEQWAIVLGYDLETDFIGLAIDHKDFDDGLDNFSERVFLWGNTGFRISDAEFVVTRTLNEDGSYSYTRSIENFAILPLAENFDFSSADPSTELTQWVSQHAIDPSGIGRRVNINFADDVQRITFTEEDYWNDVASFGDLGYGKFELNLPRQLQLQSGTQQIFESLFADGISSATFLDKLVVYGTNEGDTFSGWITPEGHNLLQQYENVGPYSFLMAQFQLALNGLTYVAGDGDDVVTGTSKEDILIGNDGADQLFGGGADDFIFFDFADGPNVYGGAGRDVAVALGQDGVTVDMAAQGLECVIGCDGADSIMVSGGTDPVFAAGGGGADHFIFDNLEAQGPRILWGGAGADVFEFRNGGRVSLAAVNIDGLTEEAFSRLTLEDLGLGDIDVSLLSAIIINPDATDRFYSDDLLLGTSSVSLLDWSQIGDDQEFLDHLVSGYSSPVSFGVRTSGILGGSYAIQAVFEDEVRAHHQATFNYNYFDITVWSNGEYTIVETEDYVEHWIQDRNEAIDDALMAAELMFADLDQYADCGTTAEYWTVQDRSNMPTGPFLVVGGAFGGNSLFANDDLLGSLPDDSGPSAFDWLLAA